MKLYILLTRYIKVTGEWRLTTGLFFLSICLVLSGCAGETLPADSSYLTISRGDTDYTRSGAFTFDSLKTDSATVIHTFTISNITKDRIEVSRIECSSPGSFTFYSSSLPGILPPEGSVDFELGFHPLRSGAHESVLSLYLSGYEEPFIFRVSGNGL